MQIYRNMKQTEFCSQRKLMFRLKREFIANPERMKCLLFTLSEKCHVLSSFPNKLIENNIQCVDSYLQH